MSLLAAAMWSGGAAGVAQTLDDLLRDAETPGDILVYGGGYAQQRYNPLSSITSENVNRLVPVWTYSLADTQGQESYPLLWDGTLYVTTHQSTVALDALTGRQIWKSLIDYPAETPRVVCCGIVNRGSAILDGRLFRTTLDAHVIALDAKTGEELWRREAIEFTDGYSMTAAPLIANGVLITGVSGAEYGIRGFLDGWDPATGEHLWHTYTVPAPGEPGSETWEDGGDAWKRGGGSTWLTGSYDPELNTVYWGIGNAGPWNAAVRPGDNLYTASLLALDPKTGAIKWHYQFTPNDPFDYDGTNELVLAELTISGTERRVVMQANRNGFFYVLDRETGKLLAANPFIERVDWASSIDMKTGRPIETPLASAARSGKQIEVWPSALGGKNWSPMSHNRDLGLVFANTLNAGMSYKAIEPAYRAGTYYFGADFSWVLRETEGGHLRAIEPLTGESRWVQPTDIPRLAGILSTGGGLVFTGALTGEFEAFNATTGEKLWQYQTGSGVNGQPVTWEAAGRQYVTVLSGSGSAYDLVSGDERLAQVPPGGSVWTFALME